MSYPCGEHGDMKPPETACNLAELARALNRPVAQLRQLQARFELPVLSGHAYGPPYVALVRCLVFLRALGISEETLARLWKLEKRLLKLLHVDSSGSPTWYLDSCGRRGHAKRRLLLTNHDLGVPLPARSLQLGLDFADGLPELFVGREMGEDALRLLDECLKLTAKIRADMTRERPLLREALRWGARVARG